MMAETPDALKRLKLISIIYEETETYIDDIRYISWNWCSVLILWHHRRKSIKISGGRSNIFNINANAKHPPISTYIWGTVFV